MTERRTGKRAVSHKHMYLANLRALILAGVTSWIVGVSLGRSKCVL